MDVKLSPKEHRPTAFSLLRPSTILTVSATAYTKALKGACQGYDRDPDEAMLGFRRGYQCAELLCDTSGDREEHGMEYSRFFAQIDFAKAYDSILHTAIWHRMRRRGCRKCW